MLLALYIDGERALIGCFTFALVNCQLNNIIQRISMSSVCLKIEIMAGYIIPPGIRIEINLIIRNFSRRDESKSSYPHD